MPAANVRGSFVPYGRPRKLVPSRDVWDVDGIKEMWKNVGVIVHEVRSNVHRLATARRSAFSFVHGQL